jgi:hypothetical protein
MPTYCPDCGLALSEEGETCPSCHPLTEAGSRITGDEPLVWSARMPVVTSPVVVKQLVLVLGAGVLFVAVLMLILGAYEALPVLGAIFIGLVVLVLVIAAALQFFTQGGPMGGFAMGSDGVAYTAGKESESINRITLLGSLVGGSLSGAGGSLINISREKEFMNWEEMRSVTADRRDRSLVFTRKSFLFPIAIYCTEENFDPAIAKVRKYAPGLTLRIRG